MEKTRVMGDTLKGESDEEERGKIERRLEGLATQFTELQQSADARMKGTMYVHSVHVYICMCVFMCASIVQVNCFFG